MYTQATNHIFALESRASDHPYVIAKWHVALLIESSSLMKDVMPINKHENLIHLKSVMVLIVV